MTFPILPLGIGAAGSAAASGLNLALPSAKLASSKQADFQSLLRSHEPNPMALDARMALALVGKTVSIDIGQGQTLVGKVDQIEMEPNGMYMKINGDRHHISKLIDIMPNE